MESNSWSATFVCMQVCTGSRCGRATRGCVVYGARAMGWKSGNKGVEDAMATAIRRSLCFFEWLREGTGRIIDRETVTSTGKGTWFVNQRDG